MDDRPSGSPDHDVLDANRSKGTDVIGGDAMAQEVVHGPVPAPRHHARAGVAAWLVSGRGIGTAAALAVLTLVLFRLFPDLDLAASRVFYAGDNRFSGETAAGLVARRLFYVVPSLVAVVMVALRAAHRLGARLAWAPDRRGLAFVLLSFGLGPGLLVNVVLKDHSHRPRPVQTDAFGGSLPFRPVGSFDGACRRNCSFVSGEGASSFWTVAPTLLLPGAARAGALAAAFCFGTAASLLRVAFGGHYLSDTVMAALLVWLVTAGTWQAIMRRPP